MTPARRARQDDAATAAAGPPSPPLRLPLPEPYDLDWVLGFLADRAAPSIERVTAGEVTRVVRLDGTAAVLTVRPMRRRDGSHWLAVMAAPAFPGATATGATPGHGDPGKPTLTAAAVRRLARRMFDLDTDLAAFLRTARRDRLLGPLVARSPGLRLPQLPDPFEAAVRAIVGQQVSVAGARTVVDRINRRLGDPLPGGAGLFAFPLPQTLAAAPPADLAALGLTRAKVGALIAVATATCDGTLDWPRLRTASPEAAQAALVALPGIGPWTASYLRMRALGDADAFPAADLGILKALAHPTAAQVAALAEAWRPYRAYAAIHLWRSLSD